MPIAVCHKTHSNFDNLAVICVNVGNVVYGGSLINFLPDTDGPLAAGWSEDIHHAAPRSSAASISRGKTPWRPLLIPSNWTAPTLRPPRARLVYRNEIAR